MNNNTFLTLSKQESIQEYKSLLNNCDEKWSICEDHINKGQYNLAVSMAIISTEELVKSMIVFSNTLGFEFGRSKEMERFFRDHSIRFLVALGLFALNDLWQDMAKILMHLIKEPNTIERWKEEMNNFDGFMEQKLKPYLEKKAEIYRIEFEWFSKLEALRQDGFYYDYNEVIQNASSFSQEAKCKDVYEKLKIVQTMGKGFIASYDNNNESIQNLQPIIQEWDQKNYYQKVDKMLLLLRKASRNPFDAIRQKMLLP